MLKNQQMIKNYPAIGYNIISTISNICSSRDIYVKTVLNHDGEFYRSFKEITEMCIDIQDVKNAFDKINHEQLIQNQQQMKELNEHISYQLNLYKVVEVTPCPPPLKKL